MNATGLAAGRRFEEHQLGEDAGELPADLNDAEDESAQGDREQQQDQTQHQAPSTGRLARQQQQAQARNETIARKADRGQSTLTFVAHDKAVLDQLPAFVRQQLPFIPTARGAIDVQLMTMLKLFGTAGVGFAAMVKVLKELQNTQYYQHMLVYFSCAAAVASASKPAGKHGAQS